jgi:tRNA(Arg) A34 adenosine deaminase TadA
MAIAPNKKRLNSWGRSLINSVNNVFDSFYWIHVHVASGKQRGRAEMRWTIRRWVPFWNIPRRMLSPIAVIVCGNMEEPTIVEGSNKIYPYKDPTAHAEIVAIREACTKFGRIDLNGCIMYTSCEPCPMCLGAIYWAGLKHVYYADNRDDAEKCSSNNISLQNRILFHLAFTISYRKCKISGNQIAKQNWCNVFQWLPKHVFLKVLNNSQWSTFNWNNICIS